MWQKNKQTIVILILLVLGAGAWFAYSAYSKRADCEGKIDYTPSTSLNGNSSGDYYTYVGNPLRYVGGDVPKYKTFDEALTACLLD